MRISLADGKDAFARIVRLAEQGETIIILRHGKAVAQLCQLPSEMRPAAATPDEGTTDEEWAEAAFRKLMDVGIKF
jgi:antitoxin (DNA-binding transcriptional repressor) of toxin-antitoxin stability system